MAPNTERQGQIPDNKTNEKAADHNHINCVIAVMSGKGGVGKSFVTGLLASGLANDGYQVGILDADITGPSIPMLYGLHGPVGAGQYGIEPLISRSGIKVISANLVLESEDMPIVWRGPLISKAIKQLWEDVMWGELDYLLVDLPPGTADAALTIMQSIPLKGVIMVTTPQKLATLIVTKAVHMAQDIGIPVIGVIENVAFYRCPDTGKKHLIYGKCHGIEVAETARAPLLAQIPLDPSVAELCDEGKIEEVVLDESNDLVKKFIEAIQDDNGYKQSSEISPINVAEKPGLTGNWQPEKEGINANNPANNGELVDTKLFSLIARQLIETKENMGSLEHPDGRGYYKGWCGDSMQIDLRIDGIEIVEARFLTDGCEATIACGSMLTKMACAKTIRNADEITPEDLLAALGGLPEPHQHCAELAVKTLREAVTNALMSRQDADRP
jgi:Mrp family chromosome partitioning ATPase/NifU-like protein involved in Fe-S cluster formation